MAVSTLQKLFKNSLTPARILASLHNPHINSPNPTKPFIFAHQTQQPQQLKGVPNENNTINTSKVGSLSDLDSLPFSTIHPFGFCSYPILLTGSIQGVPNDEDSSGMWADSVKKKRKKKMNKHKYKKLRKRLRRRT